MKYLVTSILFIFSMSLCGAQDNSSFASSTMCLPVSNLEESIQWYKQLLGEVENFSPAEGVMEFKLNDQTWLQLFEGTQSTGSILRLEVEDIRRQHKRLEKLGVKSTPIELVPDVVSYFDFEDPDGNQLSFYKLEMP